MENLTQEEWQVVETLLQQLLNKRLSGAFLEGDERWLRPSAVEAAYRKVQKNAMENDQ